MQQDPQAILTQVLTIINYAQDKQEFIKQFNILCIQKAVAGIASNFTEDRQKEFFTALEGKNDAQSFKAAINQFVTDEEYNKAVETASAELFEDFLNSIEPSLTEEQATALDNYLATIVPDAPPSVTPHSQG